MLLYASDGYEAGRTQNEAAEVAVCTAWCQKQAWHVCSTTLRCTVGRRWFGNKVVVCTVLYAQQQEEWS